MSLRDEMRAYFCGEDAPKEEKKSNVKVRKFYGSAESYREEYKNKLQKPIIRSRYAQELWEIGAGFNA